MINTKRNMTILKQNYRYLHSIIKPMKYLFISFLFVCTQAFAGEPKSNPTHGTYSSGQKAKQPTNGHNSVLELKLNDDNTFVYYNETNPKKIVEVKGTWEVQDKYIVLKSSSNTSDYPNKWKLDQSYSCIKARKGMEFIRICSCSN